MSRKLVVRRQSHSSSQPKGSGRLLRFPIVGVAAIAGLLAAGCSADISRFDGQGFGLTDSNSATIPPKGMRKGEATNLGDATPEGGTSSPGGTYYPPSSNRSGNAGGSVRMSSLPEPVGPTSPPPTGSAPLQRTGSIAPRPAAQAKPIAAGTTIEVAQGDTLFGIAKKHAVPVNELMSVNNLTAPTIKPGQKLVLPASRSISRTATPHKPIQRAEPVRVAALPQQNAGPSAPVSPIPVSSAAPSNWTGSHAVKPGENLYGIARANRISLNQLQQVNGIVDATKVKPGTILKVPGGAVTASTAPDAPVAAPASKVAGAATTAETPRITQMATKPVIINSQPVQAPQQVAAIDPVEPPTDTQPSVTEPKATSKKGTDVASAGGAAVAGQKFRWPVKGRVIATYGSRT
ncbi:MAG: LysM peptidoglycan-binding domain-containing protein, partial [Hyphomicrobiaceae bacterium]